MFVYDIKFNFKTISDDAVYALTWFNCALSGNNQIIFETLNISGGENECVGRVTVPYLDSLDEKYFDKYVKEAHDHLMPFLTRPYEISYVGEDFTYQDDCCEGEEANAYALSSHPFLEDLSPIACMECRGNIPYYLLPKLSEKTQYALDCWHTSYIALDKLFSATSVGEMYAHKMLSSANSDLTKKGLEVCRMLESELKKPVYYYLYRFYGKQKISCPICGKLWKQAKDSTFDFKCDTCRLISRNMS